MTIKQNEHVSGVFMQSYHQNRRANVEYRDSPEIAHNLVCAASQKNYKWCIKWYYVPPLGNAFTYVTCPKGVTTYESLELRAQPPEKGKFDPSLPLPLPFLLPATGLSTSATAAAFPAVQDKRHC